MTHDETCTRDLTAIHHPFFRFDARSEALVEIPEIYSERQRDFLLRVPLVELSILGLDLEDPRISEFTARVNTHSENLVLGSSVQIIEFVGYIENDHEGGYI